MSGVWDADGIILFSRPGGGLQRVPAAGGVCTDVVARGRYPSRLPDGRHFLVYLNEQGKNPAGLYTGVLDGSADQALDLVFPHVGPVQCVSSSDGKRTWLVYFQEGASWLSPSM